MSRNLTLLEFFCFWATQPPPTKQPFFVFFTCVAVSMMSMVYLRKWSVTSVEGAVRGPQVRCFRAWVRNTKLSRDDYLLSSNEDEIVAGSRALFDVHFCQSSSSYANTLEIVWAENERTTVAHFLEARCINWPPQTFFYLPQTVFRLPLPPCH